MAFEKHVLTISRLTLLSRLTGLARDAAQSRVFGSGPVMDAFALAFQVPNLFRRLFGEGALTASFVPTYTTLERADPEAARRFAGTLLTLLTILLAGITLLGEAVLASLPTSTPDQSLTVRLTAVMLPYMPMVCVVALLGTILGVHGRFGPAAFSPIVLNLAIVGGCTLAWMVPGAGESSDRARIGWVAMAVLVAGALQLAWMAWSMRGLGVRPAMAVRADRQPLGQVIRSMAPMMIGLASYQINVLIDSLIASYPTAVGPTILGMPFPLEQGSNATLNWAARLYEFPLGVFGIAVATAIYPSLARQAGEPAALVHMLRRGVRLVAFIGIPASVGLMLVADPLAAAVYQGGRCGPEEVRQIATVLVAFAPAVAAFSAIHLLSRALYALGDARTPARITMRLVGLNLVINLVVIFTPLGLSGLAWSTSVCAYLNAAMLWRSLNRRVGHLLDDVLWRSLAKTMLASAVMAVAVVLVGQALPEGGAWSMQLLRLTVLATVGALVVFLMARWLHMPEWRWAIGRGDAEPAAEDLGS
jgi:putative peptidoglycan lipid II flippase